MKKNLFLRITLLCLAVAALATACSGGSATTANGSNQQMVADLLAKLPDDYGLMDAKTLSTETNAFILDVRTADEFAGGHIDGSVNIPLKELTNHLDQLPATDQEIVVVCGIGHRGAIGMAVLDELGYTNVHSLKNGLTSWKEAGLTLVQ